MQVVTVETNDDVKGLPSITVEDLIGLKDKPIYKSLEFDLPDGTTLKRKVVFRRLTYSEISAIRKIPENEVDRYTQTVVFTGSIEPKFELADDVPKAPHGFIVSFSRLILAESGKDPFLEKG